MKATIISKNGNKEIELPKQFNEQVREDLIKRAFLAIQSHKRQPYGTDQEAGKKHSSKISRRRRDYKTAYGIGISRVPRKIMSHSGTRFNWVAAAVPYAVGGMQAHAPKPFKNWELKINDKERKKAIRSAMSASINKDLVLKRGHKINVNEFPFVLESNVEKISKAKEAKKLLLDLGLKDELERSSKTTQKTGRAKRRGRTKKQRKGPLIVVSEKCALMKALRNIPGIDVVDVKSLNVELLAPGATPGRLTLYTESALDVLKNENLFFENLFNQTEKKEDKKEKNNKENNNKETKNKEKKNNLNKTTTKKTKQKGE
ncbi:MAG: 50S ribosomal protein L4 [Candidatus Woesearchaeota archaeon]